MIFNKSKYNEEWDTLLLSKLGAFNRGKSKHRPRNDKKLFENGEYPLVQTGEIRQANLYICEHSACYNDFGLSQSKLWPQNTLCITIAANIAETALLDYPMCFPDSIVGFNAFEGKTTEEFIHYVFTYIKQAIQNSVQGSIQDNINLGYLSKLKIKAPAFSEQNRIINVLKTIDSKIELNKKINEELEAMAKLIYDYWFVQFDFPDDNGKPYKSSGGKMVFNEALNREIPENFRVKELSEIANITMGSSPPGSSYNENGEGEIFFQGSTDFGWRFPSVRQFTTKPKRMAEVGDILLSVRAPVGTLNFADNSCCIGRGLAALNSKDDVTSYLFYVMLYFKKIFDLRSATGTTFGSITKDGLHSLKVAYPPSSLLSKFDSIVSQFNQKVFLNHQESKRLEALRDWLLPMLMNGQVTVAEAEQKMSLAAEREVEYNPAKTQKATIIPFPQRRKVASEVEKLSGISTIDTQAGSMCRIFVLYDNHDSPKEHFGRTKTEKANHVIESHAKVDMGRMPERMARGAADFQRLVNKVEYKAAKRGWFNAAEINGVIHYRKGTRFFEPYQKLGAKKDEVDRIIRLFIPLTTHEAEVRQTVYAAWHDLIAYGQSFSDDEIVTFASTEEYWVKEKEEIPKKEFYEAIEWLRENNLVPDGRGKLTIKQ